MSHKLKRSPLPHMPHLIIQTGWMLKGERGEGESCISDRRSISSWKWCGLHACSPPACVLPPILISLGASWRGSRTAVQLAARRLFISSTSLPLSLPACLPACLSACLPVCLPACLPVCMPVCLPACLHPPQIAKCKKTDCQSIYTQSNESCFYFPWSIFKAWP